MLQGKVHGASIAIEEKGPVVQTGAAGISYLLVDDLLARAVDSYFVLGEHFGKERQSAVPLTRAERPLNRFTNFAAIAVPGIPTNRSDSDLLSQLL